MVIDKKKLDRQTIGFKKWLENLKTSIAKAGIVQWATGVGKTFLAVMVIKDMNDRHPDRTTIVVVPTMKLKDDWTGYWSKNKDGTKTWIKGHIEIHSLKQISIFVINTYTSYTSWTCDLLVIDEIHHALSLESKFFSTVIAITKYRFGLGLTATLNEKQIELAESLGWNIVDTITDIEAEREGFITNSITYNLAIKLSEADMKFNNDINENFKYYFGKFNFEFELMRACSIGDNAKLPVRLNNKTYLGTKTGREWREYAGRKKGWDGSYNHTYSPESMMKYAAQGMYTMGKRKTVWQNIPSKFYYIKQLVEKFSYLKTIVFSETSDFADKVVDLFPEKAVAYHSNLVTIAIKGSDIVKEPKVKDKPLLKASGYVIKGKTVLKKEAIEKFIDSESNINVLSAVRALDEGMDIPKIEFLIKAAYNSTVKQGVQRDGRGKRIDYDNLDKKTLIVNLYCPDTPEEKWLRAAQSGGRLVRWVTDVSEINLNQSVSLYVPRNSTAVEAGSSSNTAQL